MGFHFLDAGLRGGFPVVADAGVGDDEVEVGNGVVGSEEGDGFLGIGFGGTVDLDGDEVTGLVGGDGGEV